MSTSIEPSCAGRREASGTSPHAPIETAGFSDCRTTALMTHLVDNIPGTAVYRFVETPERGIVFEYMSDRFEELTGYPASAVLANSGVLFYSVHEEDAPVLLEARKRSIKKGEHFDQAFRLRHKDGTWRWIRSRSRPEFGPGRAIIWDGVLIDVTETHEAFEAKARAERALAANEQRLRWAFEATQDGVLEIDLTTNRVFVSPRMYQLMGYEPGEIPLDMASWLALGHPEDLQRSAQLFAEHAAGRLPNVDMVYRARHKNGHTIWLWTRSKIVERDAHQKPLRLVATVTDTTREKTMEMELAKLAMVARETGDSVSIIDKNGRMEWINEAGARLSGHRPEEIIGRSILELGLGIKIDPETMRQVEEHIAHCQAYSTEAWFERRDGERVCISMNIKPIRDHRSEVDSFLIVAHDITARARAEEALRESEARFRMMADHAPVLIWMSDTTSHCTYFNKTWLDFTGRTLEEELNDGWAEGVHPDDRARCMQTYLESFAARKPFEMEYRLRRHDGAYRWLIDCGQPRFSKENGEFVGFIGSCSDITTRRETEDKLRASEEHLRDAQETADIGSWRFFIDRQEIQWSEHLMRIFRRDLAKGPPSFQEYLGYLRPEDQQEILRLIQQAVDHGIPYEVTFQVKRDDGSIGYMHGRGNVRRDASGRAIELYGTTQDVTEQVRAEKERRELQERLASAERFESLGVLAGGIAHDFNNLLMGVLMEASLLEREIPPRSSMAEAVKNVQEAAKRMSELTSQLLAYAGRGQFVLEKVEPNAVVRDMLELLRRNVNKEASLESEILFEPATLEIDASQLRQVIMNLVLNASDALEGKPGRIAVRTRVLNDSRGLPAWELEVRDSGAGMSDEVRKRIFDPFFTTKKNGRGLGLSTVHGIVQRCKGEIEVQSERGQGATFQVRFPLVGGSPAEANAPEPPPVKRRSLRILIADDEATVRRSIRRMLELSSAKVVEVADGAAALEALNHTAEPFDLVLLDVVMPRKSGYEVLAEVREKHPALKVILMSGYNNPAAIPGAKQTEHAADAALQKPFAWTDFENALQLVFRSGQPATW